MQLLTIFTQNCKTIVPEYLDWASLCRNEIATGFLSTLSKTRAVNVWRLHLVHHFPWTVAFACFLQKPKALVQIMNTALRASPGVRLDSALVFCGAEYGSVSSRYENRHSVFCSRNCHRRFFVVHDLGKPCVVTGLEVHCSNYCDSNPRTMRLTATARVPHWVQHVGPAQETASNDQIKPEQDYTKNVQHPASKLRWIELKARRCLHGGSSSLVLPAALCGRFVIFYCIDGERGLAGNIDIGFMNVHGYPIKLNESLPPTSETDSALTRLRSLTEELTVRALKLSDMYTSAEPDSDSEEF